MKILRNRDISQLIPTLILIDQGKLNLTDGVRHLDSVIGCRYLGVF
jgi:hypothetical protein